MKKTLQLKRALLSWYYDNGVEQIANYPLKEVKKTITSNKTILNKNTDAEILSVKAKTNAKKLSSLNNLEEFIKNSLECGLKVTSKNTVFSDGNPKAKVMLLGEAPGEEEDLKGTPFVGQAGVLLDKMLAAIGQDRSNTYLSNIIYWRPPGNRKPTEEEIQICLPYVIRHIELINPKILILTGATAAKSIYRVETGITQIRGSWKSVHLNNGSIIRAMAIFHPAFLIRQPARKKEAWEDLKKIKIEIDKIT